MSSSAAERSSSSDASSSPSSDASSSLSNASSLSLSSSLSNRMTSPLSSLLLSSPLSSSLLRRTTSTLSSWSRSSSLLRRTTSSSSYSSSYYWAGLLSPSLTVSTRSLRWGLLLTRGAKIFLGFDTLLSSGYSFANLAHSTKKLLNPNPDLKRPLYIISSTSSL